MALGKQNRIEGKAYSLKLKLKDGDKFLETPVFDVQEKQGDKYVSVGRETDVAGDLIKIETRVGDYEGQPIRNVTAALKDFEKGEIYYVGFSLGSGIGRGLANSLLNLKSFDNVQIGLYGQKSKKDGKVYGAVAVRQGDDNTTVKWKHDPKAENTALPPAREFAGKGGKVEKDLTTQEEFFLAQLAELAKVVEEAAKNAPKVAPKAVAATTSAPTEQTEDGEPPF
jgi:hypothetical protein